MYTLQDFFHWVSVKSTGKDCVAKSAAPKPSWSIGGKSPCEKAAKSALSSSRDSRGGKSPIEWLENLVLSWLSAGSSKERLERTAWCSPCSLEPLEPPFSLPASSDPVGKDEGMSSITDIMWQPTAFKKLGTKRAAPWSCTGLISSWPCRPICWMM